MLHKNLLSKLPIKTKRRKKKSLVPFRNLNSGKMQLSLLVSTFPVSLLNINTQVQSAWFVSEVQGFTARTPQKIGKNKVQIEVIGKFTIKIYLRIL